MSKTNIKTVLYLSTTSTYEESPRGAASGLKSCPFSWVTSHVSPELLSHATGLKI